MKKTGIIFLAHLMLFIIASPSETEISNNGHTKIKSYSYCTQRLTHTAEQDPDNIAKVLLDCRNEEGGDYAQLQKAHSCAVQQRKELSAWNLSKIYLEKQNSWWAEVKIGLWSCASFAAGVGTVMLWNKLKNSGNKKEQS